MSPSTFLFLALTLVLTLYFTTSLTDATPYGSSSLHRRHVHTHRHPSVRVSEAALAHELQKAKCAQQQDFDLSGVWVKHDRAVVEVFHINITCVANCLSMESCMANTVRAANTLPSYEAYYLTGPLAGHNTFNITNVGDYLSSTGTYNNFADDSGDLACPAPFALIMEDDTNVVLVTYGATYGTVCGDYTGDSARYYRQAALE